MVKSDIGADKIVLELQNPDPTGSEGRLDYNSSEKNLKVYDGSAWVAIGSGGSLTTMASLFKVADYTITSGNANGTTIIARMFSPYLFTLGGQDGSVTSTAMSWMDSVSTTGNALSRSALTAARCGNAGIKGASFSFSAAGWAPTYGTLSKVIEYIDSTITIGNAISKGSVLLNAGFCTGYWSKTMGLAVGGYDGATCISAIQVWGLLTFAGSSTATAALLVGKSDIQQAQSLSYGFVMGGGTGASNIFQNTVEYFDLITLISNSVSKGTLAVVRGDGGGCSGPVYGFACGGKDNGSTAYNSIEYIDITVLTGNSNSKGTLPQVANRTRCASGPVYGYTFGGSPNSSGTSVYNNIYYLDMTTTTGGASSKGTLPGVLQWVGAC